jgi:hypothetical protein
VFAFVGSVLPVAGFFVLLVLAMEIGRQVRLRQLRAGGEGSDARFGIVDSAIFALMGLLVGFTFASANSRFDARRQTIVDEANAIGTAWLRLDVLSDPARASLQGHFRRYTDARLEAFRALPDTMAALAAFARADTAQRAIWREAVAATRTEPLAAPVFLLPPINEMIDLGAVRQAQLRAHLPTPIYILLLFLVFGCGIMAGYAITTEAPRSWTHVIGFCAVLTVAIWVIMDLEYPRKGLITLRQYDQVLEDQRRSMGD